MNSVDSEVTGHYASGSKAINISLASSLFQPLSIIVSAALDLSSLTVALDPGISLNHKIMDLMKAKKKHEGLLNTRREFYSKSGGREGRFICKCEGICIWKTYGEGSK